MALLSYHFQLLVILWSWTLTITGQKFYHQHSRLVQWVDIIEFGVNIIYHCVKNSHKWLEGKSVKDRQEGVAGNVQSFIRNTITVYNAFESIRYLALKTNYSSSNKCFLKVCAKVCGTNIKILIINEFLEIVASRRHFYMNAPWKLPFWSNWSL